MSFIGAAIAGGTSLIGAGIQASAAGSAADKQSAAASESNRLQREMWQTQQANQEPWRQAGIAALSRMQDADFQKDFNAENFQGDPGYAFRMAEGQKALERSAAARGGLQSGGTLKALTRYGQDFASNEFTNAYNRFNADRDRRFGRLSSLAGVGQTAVGQLGEAGQNYAANVGNTNMKLGNTLGASAMAQGNAWSGAVGNIGSQFGSAVMAPKWAEIWKRVKQNGA